MTLICACFFCGFHRPMVTMTVQSKIPRRSIIWHFGACSSNCWRIFSFRFGKQYLDREFLQNRMFVRKNYLTQDMICQHIQTNFYDLMCASIDVFRCYLLIACVVYRTIYVDAQQVPHLGINMPSVDHGWTDNPNTNHSTMHHSMTKPIDEEKKKIKINMKNSVSGKMTIWPS